MKLRTALLAILLAASQAWAVGGLEAMRANASGLRGQVAQLRTEQLARRNELSVLSSRIEALKSQSKGALVTGSELDQALKRSQELSGGLTELAQQLATRESELEASNVALLEGLSAELSRIRAEFDRQTDRVARKGLIDRMRSLRAERESVRAALPATKLPTLETLRPTDDPEQLLEQADLLRDNEEKVQRELKALESRIAQRKEEVELDRRVQRFMGEESMFDDQDRRLRLQRKDSLAGEPPSAGSVPTRNSTQQTPESLADSSFQGTASPGPVTAGSAPPDRAPAPLFPGALGAPPTAGTRASGANEFDSANTRGNTGSAFGNVDSRGLSITSSSDARPQVGSGTRSIATGDDDEMDDLDIQRRKLKGLAEELKRKAQELEKKAAQLK